MTENDLQIGEKKYIEIIYNPVTQGYLRAFCQAHGFDLSEKWNGVKIDPEDFEFHTTVFYSTSYHDDIENGRFPVNVLVKPVGFDLFGENGEVLVLRVESVRLTMMRDFYAKAYGMKDEWPDYKAHITLCYNHTGEVPDNSILDDLTEPLIAEELHIKRNDPPKKD